MDVILVLRKLLTNGRKFYRGDKYFRSTSSNIVIFYIDLNYYVKNRIDSCKNKKVMGGAKIAPFWHPRQTLSSLRQKKQKPIENE